MDLLTSKRVIVELADDWKGGSDVGAHNKGYDAIHVGAAAESIPNPLLTQLKVKNDIYIYS